MDVIYGPAEEALECDCFQVNPLDAEVASGPSGTRLSWLPVSPSLQLSVSSKISLSSSCGELRTVCSTRLLKPEAGSLPLPAGSCCGEDAEPQGDDGVIGEVGETELQGVVRPEVKPEGGLRRPNPMFDVVGKGAGTSTATAAPNGNWIIESK